ncbi:MAG TPA: exodeoxyribonuclease VII large subunit [Candidatus Cloacimonadota bacterium]|nr:exodeoxyribonuclease VII large subunit [Candidatus Cloacimonadota bacterium]
MQEENYTDESLIFTVSEVTLHIKQVLETQIEEIYITGEISNFVRHTSGHIYFNLKDENAVIRCAFFRNQNYQLEFEPQDGDQVVCFGKITVFEKSGQYQLIVRSMFPSGKGALLRRFELLKKKLEAEGLFAKEHKKSLPRYPERIGIITSPTGAALQDILNILKRRYPCEIDVYPSLMQGEEVPAQVIEGIQYFNAARNVDLIIIARGGGSQEDLFWFNDENLARAIYASELPVVSAIGHEIDFTIPDFVADVRAPTPSAAAELCTPDKNEIFKTLKTYAQRFSSGITAKLATASNAMHTSQIKLMQNSPERIYQSLQQRYDEAEAGLEYISVYLSQLNKDFLYRQKIFCRELANAGTKLTYTNTSRLNLSALQLRYNLQNQLQVAERKLNQYEVTLSNLSLKQTLARGYAVIRSKGAVVNSVRKLKPQDEVELILADGLADATIKDVKNKLPDA